MEGREFDGQGLSGTVTGDDLSVPAWVDNGGAPVATDVTVVCAHGGRSRPHVVDSFVHELGFWIGDCGPLAPGESHLGPDAFGRSANERKPGDAQSVLFYQPGVMPRWRGRCRGCSRQPRDRRTGRRSVRGQVDIPGAVLLDLLDGAASAWLPTIDLFDLANHGGRGTLDAISDGQAGVAASWADEQRVR